MSERIKELEKELEIHIKHRDALKAAVASVQAKISEVRDAIKDEHRTIKRAAELAEAVRYVQKKERLALWNLEVDKLVFRLHRKQGLSIREIAKKLENSAIRKPSPVRVNRWLMNYESMVQKRLERDIWNHPEWFQMDDDEIIALYAAFENLLIDARLIAEARKWFEVRRKKHEEHQERLRIEAENRRIEQEKEEKQMQLRSKVVNTGFDNILEIIEQFDKYENCEKVVEVMEKIGVETEIEVVKEIIANRKDFLFYGKEMGMPLTT